MTDLITGALIAGVAGVIGTAMGALISGLTALRVAREQSEAIKVERLAAEAERQSIRLEEAARSERAERVRPIRGFLDRLVEHLSHELVLDVRAGNIAATTGEDQLLVLARLEAEQGNQEKIEDSMAVLHVASARAPQLLYLKILDLVQLFLPGTRDRFNAAKLVARAAEVHKAIEEYIAAGTVDSRDPHIVGSTEETDELMGRIEKRFRELTGLGRQLVDSV